MIRVLIVMLACVPAAARADLPPGVYAVACGRAMRGDTRAQALAACKRAWQDENRSRRGRA